MPRKSAAALAIATPPGLPGLRLATPPELTPEQGTVFRATVDALPVTWFSREQVPMLEQYARCVCRVREIEAVLAKTRVTDGAPYDRLTRLAKHETALMLRLARSLRLTVQSRLRPTTAHNRARKGAAPGSGVDFTRLFGANHGGR
jgi:hypothetical protein